MRSARGVAQMSPPTILAELVVQRLIGADAVESLYKAANANPGFKSLQMLLKFHREDPRPRGR